MNNELRVAMNKAVDRKESLSDEKVNGWLMRIVICCACFLLGASVSLLYIFEKIDKLDLVVKYIIASMAIGFLLGMVFMVTVYLSMLWAHDVFFGVRR